MKTNGINQTEGNRQKAEAQHPALTTTAGGVARMLSVSIRQVWRLNTIGRLPKPLRLGNCVRWRVDEIRAFVAAGCPSRQEWEAMQNTEDRSHD